MSHIVVLRPYSYGYKTSTAAKVTYKHSESDDQVQVSFSNDLGPLPVLSSKDDDKLAAPHMVLSVHFFRPRVRWLLCCRNLRRNRGGR